MSVDPSARPGTTFASNFDMARMPVPGNAEFLFWLASLLLVAIVALISDSVDSSQWVEFAKWASAAYLISRGIAKASRVLEH
jgi:hypothetical protein